MSLILKTPIALLFALTVTTCAVTAKADAGTSKLPDFLLIMPDQMRGDCLSALKHPVVRTPNLDQLAREGVLFRRGYSTVPSCIPARYALLTGMSPQASGVVGYRSKRITEPTLPGVLGKAGYATVLVGRTMHQNPPNKSVGYQKEILGSTYVDNDDYDRELLKAAPESGGISAVIKRAGVTTNFWEANPWPLADEWHPTAWAVRTARKIVADMPAGQPLFLTASLFAPHPPLFPPKNYFDAILKADLPAPAHGDWVNWRELPTKRVDAGDRVLLTGDVLRKAQAGYYGSIEHIDEQIAPLIAAFKARSEKAGRPWVIVFTSDHGEMLEDHGYFRKCEPYEGATNIPFIVAGSKELGFQTGVRAHQPVALEDVMPTLLALAGIQPPSEMTGVNLLSALRDAAAVGRKVLHSEHAPCYNAAQAFQSLTDGHFKYIWRPANGREQLFNLDTDPREEHDLSGTDAVKEWRQRLIQELAGRPEGFSDGQRLIPGRPYPAIMKID